jgi:peptide methionine sulfoxide reductase msrA/msrB
MKLRKLNPAEMRVIEGRGTEMPFSGEYDKFFESGIYVCKRCGAPLYRSEDKFDAHCGWPSFDDELPKAVERLPDPDGLRTEIRCARCSAHLGHVFSGELLTKKDVRHCVNSISMLFIPESKVAKDTIVLGGGCFWCTEAVFSLLNGILRVMPGYAGGTAANPTYELVCEGNTGHAEVVKVEFFPEILPLARLLELFLAMHDPTSLNRQGSDEGTQYRSIILCTSKKQVASVKRYLKKAQAEYDRPIVTEVELLDKFYPAEEYHLRYFEKNPHVPYCTFVISPKVAKIKKEFGL